VKLRSRHTAVVVPALVDTYARLDSRLRVTLTRDRGMELAAHKSFSAASGVDVFFAAPRSPGQRSTNENSNKLLRQYLPKGTNLSTFSQDDLDAIAMKLNTRPRKCLGFRTPAESVALTG
jgi:transposase, IS30 family